MADAIAVEATIVVGATIRLDGSIDRHPATVAAPFYCALHGGAR